MSLWLQLVPKYLKAMTCLSCWVWSFRLGFLGRFIGLGKTISGDLVVENLSHHLIGHLVIAFRCGLRSTRAEKLFGAWHVEVILV